MKTDDQNNYKGLEDLEIGVIFSAPKSIQDKVKSLLKRAGKEQKA